MLNSDAARDVHAGHWTDVTAKARRGPVRSALVLTAVEGDDHLVMRAPEGREAVQEMRDLAGSPRPLRGLAMTDAWSTKL
jgi:hypothetical protein